MMSARKKQGFRSGLIAMLLCLSLVSGVSQAETPKLSPAAQLIPEDPFLFITWDGMDAHRDAWKKTASYDSLQQSGLGTALQKWLNTALSQLPPKESDRLRRFGSQILKSGVTVAISAPSDAAAPLPYTILVLHNAAPLEAELTQTLTEAMSSEGIKVTSAKSGKRTITTAEIPRAPDGMELGWWTEGKHLVFAAGFGAVQIATQTADAERKNVTASASWKKYSEVADDSKCELTALAWIDFAALVKTYGGFPLPESPNPKEPILIRELAKAAGLENVGRFVYQRGYRGRATWTISILEAAAPRQGAFGLVDGPEISLSDLPPLPTDTAAFVASSIDWSKLFAEGVATAKRAAKLGPQSAQDDVDGAVQSLPAALGFNPQTDLFDTLGNVTCVYNDTRHGYLGIAPVVAISLKDAAKLRTTIDGLLERNAAPRVLVVKQAEKQGHLIRHLLIAGTGFGPAIAIEKDWFVLGITPQAVEAFTLRMDKQLNRWEPSSAEKEGLAELPQKFTSVSISQPHKVYSLLISMAPALLQVAELGMKESRAIPRNARLPISAADLPTAELVERPLFPSITVGTSSKEGFRWITRSAGPAD